MASLSREPEGRKTVQVVLNGKRQSIRLGKMSLRDAETVRLRIEDLAASLNSGRAWDNATAEWVAGLDSRLAGKLERIGLIRKRTQTTSPMTVAEFLDDYLAKRGDVKESTRLVLGHTRRCLVEYFKDKPIADITDGDADDFRLWLVSHADPADKTVKKLADNTVRRRCGIARQYFKAAMKRGLVTRNPFAEMPVTVRGNPKRMYFLSRADAQKVLDACPDAQWRLLFALARFGGLRIPSEALALTWGDINWAAGRFTVHSPKTEHHEGKDQRVVPIFPELEPYLLAVWDDQAPNEPIITRYTNVTQNVGTQLARIVRAAGLSPWPKLWQNLRATRETELSERWPIKTVCEWIGNSRLVAAEHYLTVPEEHFQQAVVKDGAHPEPKALQKAVQYPVKQGRTASKSAGDQPTETAFSDEIPRDSTGLDYQQKEPLGVTGLEPVTLRV